MKKIAFLSMIVASMVYAIDIHAARGSAPEPSVPDDRSPLSAVQSSNRMTFLAAALGATVLGGLQLVPEEIVSHDVVTVLQLSTALMTGGLIGNKYGLRHAALVAPAIVIVAKLAENKPVREIAYQFPMGIGDALKNTGDKATTAILTVGAYVYGVMPLLESFYQTRIGKQVLGKKS